MTNRTAVCPEHQDYSGQRRPRRDCPSCWRVYFNNSGKTIREYAEATDDDTQSYLWRNLSKINNAPVMWETSVESIAEIASEEDLQEFEANIDAEWETLTDNVVEEEKPKPGKGTLI